MAVQLLLILVPRDDLVNDEAKESHRSERASKVTQKGKHVVHLASVYGAHVMQTDLE